jgi:FG-GAP-like repeat/IPT/TIG domain/FG-GAP repeat
MKKTLYLNLAKLRTPKSQTNNWFQVFCKKYSSIAQICFLALILASQTIVAQRPTINSFSPTSGPIGTSVTISGTQFNTTAAQNIVYFGATRATVTFASPSTTSLTVTVPVGATYQAITVLNTATNLVGSSASPFNVTFPGLISPTSFNPNVDFTTGIAPSSISIGDLDGDGKPDLVCVNIGSNTVSVFRNTSISGSITASSFTSKVDLAIGAQASSVSIGDLDGDGKPDLVVTNNISYVSVFRNISTSGSITTSSFANKVDFTTGSSPRSVSIGDLDGDGKPELAVANYGSNTVSILRNTSSSGSITISSFASKVDFTSGTSPSSVSFGDLDGDGKPDLAVANYNNNTVSVFRNTSSAGNITIGSFANKVDFTTGPFPISVKIGDLNGDGKPELVVANSVGSSVSVFHNTSSAGNITTGSFASKTDFTTDSSPQSVSIGDLDGDGKPDLATANSVGSSVSVLLNTSSAGSITTGSFANKVDYPTGTNPISVSIGDLDGDGKPDLAVANNGSSTMSILRNNPVLPPTISSFSPLSGAIGSSVVITGTNFNTSTAQNFVFFGATMATVTAASTTSLTVTVPTGATYQPISVLNIANGLSGFSAKPFNVTYEGFIASNGLKPKVDFTTGTIPTSINIGDLDGDGKPDLAVANYVSNTVSVYRNTSSVGSINTSSFSSKVDFVTGSIPFSVSIGDLDGDGKPEMVVANNGSNTVSVFRNTFSVGSITTSSFASKVDFTTGTSPQAVSIGDLDRDGRPDLAVANAGSNTVSIFRNTSSVGSINTGSFAFGVDIATGSIPYSVSIGDLDGDGKPDLAVANDGSNTVSIFRNTSFIGVINTGSFASKVDFATGTEPQSVSIGDLDGDGKLDLATANNISNTVSVLRNTSSSGSITTGSFAGKVDFATGLNPNSVSISDLDGDGKSDLATANYSVNSISVFQNTSSVGSITTGSFANKVDFTTGSGPYSVKIGDLDGDGKPDLVSVSLNANTLSILRQITTINSIVSGNWENTTTWKNGLIPTIGDYVIISPNHTVTLNSIRDAKYLRCKPNATLNYGNTSAKLKVGF